MNEDKESLSDDELVEEDKGLLSLEEFIGEIKDDHDLGFGFVPFIGSGLSKPSGIMIGAELNKYLSFVIYKCFSSYKHEENITAWNFSDRGWPEIPTLEERKAVVTWVKAKYRDALKHYPECNAWLKDGCWDELEAKEVGALYTNGSDKYFDRPPLYPLILKKSDLTDAAEKENQANLNEHILNFSEDDCDSFDEFQPNSKVNKDESRLIFELALRSMYDWRSMLKFLSRLNYYSATENSQGRMYIYNLSKNVNQHVIDGFNYFLIRNAYPNLAHYLLVALAQPMRVRRILTTNFDDLIETTYKKMDLPLNVIAVEKNSSLPSIRTVVSRDALIKLHGGLNETRADHSLDIQPSNDDKEVFAKYFFPDTGDNSYYLPSRMIVMGSSLSDERSVGLIKHVFESRQSLIGKGFVAKDSQFKLYYVAFNKDDYTKFLDKFQEYHSDVVCVICDRLDLLLLEIYQSLTNSLPPGGFTHQFSEFVPAIGRRTHGAEKQYIQTMQKILGFLEAEEFELIKLNTTKIYSITAKDAYRPERRGDETYEDGEVKEEGEKFDSESKIFVLDGTKNVQRLATILFDCLVQKFSKKALWFDLEDFQSPIDLLSEIPRQIALRAGLYHSEHVILDFRQEVHRKGNDIKSIESSLNNLFAFLGQKMGDWAIIINGRELAGGCSGWDNNTWRLTDKRKNYVALWNYLALLAKSGVKVFYMPFTTSASESHEEMSFLGLNFENISDCRFEKIAKKIVPTIIDKEIYNQILTLFNQLEEKQPYDAGRVGLSAEMLAEPVDTPKQFLKWLLKKMLGNNYLDRDVQNPEIVRAVSAADTSSMMTTALQGMGAKKLSLKEEAALHYLYAITLFRQSRNISALNSEALAISSWRYTCALFGDAGVVETGNWLEALTSGSSKFFLIKRGGYRWLSSKRRILIQKIIEEHADIKLMNLASQERSLECGLKQTRTIGHLWISEWYIRLFHATNHVDPLIESFYHCISAVNCLKDCRQSRQEVDVSTNNKALVDYRITILINTLSSIIKTFIISQNSLRFWMYGFQGHNLFQWKIFSESIDGLGESESLDLERWVERVIGEKFDATTFSELYSEKVIIVGELLLRISEECGKLYLNLRRESNQMDYALDFDSLRSFRERIFPTDFYSEGDYIERKLELRNLGLEFNLRYSRAYEPSGGYLDDLVNRGKGVGEIRSILEKIKKSILYVLGGKNDFEVFCDEVRQSKNDIVYQFQTQPRTFYHLTYLLSELVYVQVRRAKHIGRLITASSGFKKPKLRIADSNYPEYSISIASNDISWQVAGVLSRLCLDLMHSMHPQYIHAEHSLKIKCLTLCGLSLARLSKFSEAHDMFRQSNAIAFSLPVKDDKNERAIVRIRAAESHVLESVFIKNEIQKGTFGKGKKSEEQLFNLHLAKLDDAAAALDGAEHLLIGASHSSLWWGRVNFLRLRLFAEHYIREDALNTVYPISYRRHKDYQQFLLSTLSKGLLSSRNDAYRSVTFVDIYIQALVKVTCHFQGRREKFNDSQRAITWYLEYLRLSLRKLYSLLTIGDFNIVHPNDKCEWGRVLQLNLKDSDLSLGAVADMSAYAKHCADRIMELEKYINSAKTKKGAAKNNWQELLDREKQRKFIAKNPPDMSLT